MRAVERLHNAYNRYQTVYLNFEVKVTGRVVLGIRLIQ